MEGRYDYIPADSTAGVVIYNDKFAYSHHATDPACGKLLNAFDLVRIHMFGDEDGSYSRMQEFAAHDERVNKLLLAERLAEAAKDFGEDWAGALQRDKHGNLLNTLQNIVLILENDPRLKNIVFNQLADSMEITGDAPWKHESRFWRDADDAQLVCYVDSTYGTSTPILPPRSRFLSTNCFFAIPYPAGRKWFIRSRHIDKGLFRLRSYGPIPIVCFFTDQPCT